LGSRKSKVYAPETQLTQVLYPTGPRSTYAYTGGFPVEGEGLRRTAQEPGAAAPTQFIWDGSDYAGE
jgi:hypothetical protein